MPKELLGPILIKTQPHQIIYLKATDKGIFANGSYEIFIRANEKGLAQFDFQLGVDYGDYRILAQTASNVFDRFNLHCIPQEEVNKINQIQETTNN